MQAGRESQDDAEGAGYLLKGGEESRRLVAMTTLLAEILFYFCSAEEGWTFPQWKASLFEGEHFAPRFLFCVLG